jgi:hypothetical protein
VCAPDGHGHERAVIEAGLAQRRTSPMTGEPMPPGALAAVGGGPAQQPPPPHPSLARPSAAARDARGVIGRLHELAGEAEAAKEAPPRVPMAVVLGVQSAGKSALLERLAGLPVFPRDKGLCTRVPVRLCLRHGPRRARPCCSSEPRQDDDAWPAATWRRGAGGAATAADAVALARVRRARAWRRWWRRARAIASDAELVVVVRAGAADADVVDLPGLVAAPPSCRRNGGAARRYLPRAGWCW